MVELGRSSYPSTEIGSRMYSPLSGRVCLVQFSSVVRVCRAVRESRKGAPRAQALVSGKFRLHRMEPPEGVPDAPVVLMEQDANPHWRLR